MQERQAKRVTTYTLCTSIVGIPHLPFVALPGGIIIKVKRRACDDALWGYGLLKNTIL